MSAIGCCREIPVQYSFIKRHSVLGLLSRFIPKASLLVPAKAAESSSIVTNKSCLSLIHRDKSACVYLSHLAERIEATIVGYSKLGRRLSQWSRTNELQKRLKGEIKL